MLVVKVNGTVQTGFFFLFNYFSLLDLLDIPFFLTEYSSHIVNSAHFTEPKLQITPALSPL